MHSERTELRVGDPLPRIGEAIIDPRKLRDYALNPGHPHGAPKARVFAAVMAIGRRNWGHLRDEILLTLPEGRIAIINQGEYVTTYGVPLQINGLNGRPGPVLTAWKLIGGVPVLVTVRVDFRSLSE